MRAVITLTIPDAPAECPHPHALCLPGFCERPTRLDGWMRKEKRVRDR